MGGYCQPITPLLNSSNSHNNAKHSSTNYSFFIVSRGETVASAEAIYQKNALGESTSSSSSAGVSDVPIPGDVVSILCSGFMLTTCSSGVSYVRFIAGTFYRLDTFFILPSAMRTMLMPWPGVCRRMPLRVYISVATLLSVSVRLIPVVQPQSKISMLALFGVER